MFRTPFGLQHVAELHDSVLGQGGYLFLLEHGLDEPDVLGLVPKTDKYEVIELLGTDGNARHSHAEVVAWLKDIDHSDPWILLGASFDFVEGWFVDPVHDPHAMAHNVLSFCPDFYYQGIGLDPANNGADPSEVSEEYFKTEHEFYFWWD